MMNQPTAQFYRVALDNDFPYHVYGAQQDNSHGPDRQPRGAAAASRSATGTTSAAARAAGSRPIPRTRRSSTPGPTAVCSRATTTAPGRCRNVNVWPDNPMGYGAEAMKYRFQWNFPIAVFAARSEAAVRRRQHAVQDDERRARAGRRSARDLTRNDKSKQGPSGGPDHKGQHQRRILRHDLHGRRIADAEGRDLDRVGRRARPRDARRRQDMGERHAQGHAGMDPDQLDRGIAARSRGRVRRRDDVQAGRFPAVSLQDQRLRQDVDEDRQRHSGERLSRAWSARIRISAGCWWPARRQGCTFPTTAGRTGGRSS